MRASRRRQEKLHWKPREGQRRLRLRVDFNGADRAAELNRTRWPFSGGPGGRIGRNPQFEEVRLDDARFRPGLVAAQKLLTDSRTFGEDDLENFSVFKGIVGVSFKHDRPWKRAWQLLSRPEYGELRRAYQLVSQVRPTVRGGNRDGLDELAMELRDQGVAAWVAHGLELVDGRAPDDDGAD